MNITWFFVTHASILTFDNSIHIFRHIFINLQNVLLPSFYSFCKKSRRFGEFFEPRYIYGAFQLDQWAITLSLKGGCFQAHLLAVFAVKHPFPLKNFFGTLAFDLGCFPLDFGPLHPKSVYKVYFFVFFFYKTTVFGVSLGSVKLWTTLTHGVLYPCVFALCALPK